MRSVTRIIGRVFPFSESIPKHILEGARQRGVQVHEWIEAFNIWKREGGDKPTINLEYQIYADYYEEWFNDYEVEPIHEELKLSVEDDGFELGLVGVIDMLCVTKEHEKVLVSFKLTHSVNLPYCELQESAYNYLLVENEVIEESVPARVLHIGKRGYNYIPLEDQLDRFNDLRKVDAYLIERGVK